MANKLKLLFICISLILFFGCRSSNAHDNIVDLLSENPSNIYVVSKIIDGDTFKIWIGREQYSVRLIGIDTPESANNLKTKKDSERNRVDFNTIIQMGKRATEYLCNYIKLGDSVKLEYDIQKIDRYNRILAYVYLMDKRMLNEIMVREGYAQIMSIPPNIKYQDLFLDCQNDARENDRGLWAR